VKISEIRVYQIDLPLVEGRYSWSEGKYVEVFDSTVVELVTDDGPVLPAGIRPGCAGRDRGIIRQPDRTGPDGDRPDQPAHGPGAARPPVRQVRHRYGVLGPARQGLRKIGLRFVKFGESVALYRAISQRPADEMAENVAEHRDDGYTKFQLKVGGDPADDVQRIHAAADVLTEAEVLVADANTGWRVDDAIRVVNAVRDRDVYIEQPCRSYEHCLTVRRNTPLPFILDENITDIEALMRGHGDGAMDVINLKISKVGGLTRARQIRDLCVTLNLPMTIEDSWGGDIITAAIAHLAHSTPEALRFSATDFNSYVTVRNATGAPQRVAGHMSASDDPGLGIEPDIDVLGAPVAVFS
jgi:L-alanine-DL-glutamate epimerase-like enolase superfamily enzyme